MRACRQRFPAVDGANGHDDGNVADLKMADPMLDSDRQYIVLISSLLGTPSQHIQCAGVLGVVERDHIGALVPIAHGADEQ